MNQKINFLLNSLLELKSAISNNNNNNNNKFINSCNID